jgi:hypothetical protein
MEKFRDIGDLADFVERVLGEKGRVLTVSPSTGRMTFVLYDAHVFSVTLDARTYVFGMSLLLPGNASLIRLLGQELSVNNDPDSIANALATADRYCRLRLPDDYLVAFDRSHPA